MRLELFRNFEWARFRLGFLAAIVLCNWTEAVFTTVSATWFIFYIIAMDYPKVLYESVVESGAVLEEDAELAYPPGEDSRRIVSRAIRRWEEARKHQSNGIRARETAPELSALA